VVSPEDRAWVSGPEELKERNDDHVPRVRASEEYISYLAKNQPDLLAHLSYEVVSDTTANLPPLKTHHDFEGLIMGNDPVVMKKIRENK
ncbi:MAG: Phytanoyl-CoA dioxygenase, partial [Candidatus Saccharibacteria bacterium]|nr:Phytanoyl-CoA dioxygenase [Candidatus Saccharibacteria bacterium]